MSLALRMEIHYKEGSDLCGSGCGKHEVVPIVWLGSVLRRPCSGFTLTVVWQEGRPAEKNLWTAIS